VVAEYERQINVEIDAIAIERRQYPRHGVMGHLENVTYSALRRYGLIERSGEQIGSSMSAIGQKQANVTNLVTR
jgi:hypothetical protein